MPSASAGIVQGTDAQTGSVEDRMKHLTSVVQELAKLVTTGVAAPSAQSLKGAAQGAPGASSSNALNPNKPQGHQIPKLRLRSGPSSYDATGPRLPSSSSSGAGHRPLMMTIGQHVGCAEARSTLSQTALSLLLTRSVNRMLLRGVVQVAAGILVIVVQTRAFGNC